MALAKLFPVCAQQTKKAIDSAIDITREMVHRQNYSNDRLRVYEFSIKSEFDLFVNECKSIKSIHLAWTLERFKDDIIKAFRPVIDKVDGIDPEITDEKLEDLFTTLTLIADMLTEI